MGAISSAWKRTAAAISPVFPDAAVYVTAWVLVVAIKRGPEQLLVEGVLPELPHAFYAVTVPLAAALLGFLNAAREWLQMQSPTELVVQRLYFTCMLTPSVFLVVVSWMTLTWAHSPISFGVQLVIAAALYAVLILKSRAVVDNDYSSQIRAADRIRQGTRELRRYHRMWRLVDRQLSVSKDLETATYLTLIARQVPAVTRLLGVLLYVAATAGLFALGAGAAHLAGHVGLAPLKPYCAAFAIGVVGAALLLVTRYCSRLTWCGIDRVSNAAVAAMYLMIYAYYALVFVVTVLSRFGVAPALFALGVSLALNTAVVRWNRSVFKDGAAEPQWYRVPLAAGWSTNLHRAQERLLASAPLSPA